MLRIFVKSVLLFAVLIFLSGCESRPVPDKLQPSVRESLRYLQEDAQFAMYFNFKSMRITDFWNKHISDSVFAGESSFGTLLNIFRDATGASISDGLDELYYSNSWVGDNAILMKGIFDRDKFAEVIENDSAYVRSVYPDGTVLYNNIENGLYLFFKDKFTICSSNMLNQIEAMMSVTEEDTTPSGLQTNTELMAAVETIYYKSNLWLAATEKTFIRGIFLNFLESQTLTDEYNHSDSVVLFENDLRKFYEKVNSITFSVRMRDDLTLSIQANCIDAASAEYLRMIVNGLITVSRISAASERSSSRNDILRSITNRSYDDELSIMMKINDDNLKSFRDGFLQSEFIE